MKGLALGQKATLTRTFTADDIRVYRHLSTGDFILNYRKDGAELVPGPLLGSMFSCLLGTQLPGRGTNWLKQEFHFLHHAFVGEEITATVEIIRLRPEKELANLRTICTNPAGTIICQGEALVLVRHLETEPDPEVLMEKSL